MIDMHHIISKSNSKNKKKGLTKGVWHGNLSKLFGGDEVAAVESKRVEKILKKVLDKRN